MRRQYLQIVEEDLNQPELSAEWFLPELKSALPKSGAPDELGLRQLLEYPEAIRVRGRRTRRRRRGLVQLGDEPHWPDAAA